MLRGIGLLLAVYGTARLLGLAVPIALEPDLGWPFGRLNAHYWTVTKLILADALPPAIYVLVGIQVLRRSPTPLPTTLVALLAALIVELHAAFVGQGSWRLFNFLPRLDTPGREVLLASSALVVGAVFITLVRLTVRGAVGGTSVPTQLNGTARRFGMPLRVTGAVLVLYAGARIVWLLLVLGSQSALMIGFEHQWDTTRFIFAHGLPSLIYLLLGVWIVAGYVAFLPGIVAIAIAFVIDLLSVLLGLIDLTTYLYEQAELHIRIQVGLSTIIVAATCLLLISARRELPLRIAGPATVLVSPASRGTGLFLLIAGLTQFAVPALAWGSGRGWSMAWSIWRATENEPHQRLRLAIELFSTAGIGIAGAVLGFAMLRGRDWARGPAIILCLLGVWIGVQAIGPRGEGAASALGFLYAMVMACAFVSLLSSPPEPYMARRESDDAPSTPEVPMTSDIPDGEDWRQPLLASLRATGVHRPRLGRFDPGAARLLVLAALAILFGRLYLPRILADQPPNIVLAGDVIWIAAAMLIISPAVHAGRRQLMAARARSAVAELSRNRGRRPILYLRSFDIDRATSRSSLLEFLGIMLPLSTPEQKIARILSRAGPVIAIGRPGERLPQLGAARFYVTDELWKQKVADVARAAQLVVWTSGVSQGLRWEISHLLRTVSFEKLILWAHPHLVERHRAKREKEWTRFCSTLGPLFPRPLPQPLGDTEVFVFADDGTPLPVKPDLSGFGEFIRPVAGALKASLREVLERKARLANGTLEMQQRRA